MTTRQRRLYFNQPRDREFAIKLLEAHENNRSFVSFGLVIHPISIVKKSAWIEVEYKETGMNGAMFQVGLA